MSTLQTITTIELSNDCNLSCRYCIQSKLKAHPARKVGIMSGSIFDKTLEILKELVSRGTQREVNLNGNGEALLDPAFIERADRVKSIVGTRSVQVCTNGLNMTPELAGRLANSGVDRVDLSPHSPYHVRRAVDMFIDAGIAFGVVNMGAVTSPHNWAGQLDEKDSVTVRIKADCLPLIEGRGYVLAEGNITPCCYDYQNLGVFGHVEDADILEREYGPYMLCNGCHQEIPEWIWASMDGEK